MKQEISILINGKEQTYKQSISDEKTVLNLEKEEVAAALEEAAIEDYKVLSVPLRKKDILFNKKKKTLINRKKPGFTFQNNSNPFSKQIIAAIMAAVVTGTALGILVLMVFSTDVTEAGTSKAMPAEVQKAEPAKSTNKMAEMPAIKLELSALQAGVFSSAKTAEDAVESIEEKGFSASILPIDEGKYSVLIGIGNKKSQLEEFKTDYEKKTEEKPLYKTFSFAFKELKSPEGVDATYFTNGNILLQNVLTLSQMPKNNESMMARTLEEFNKWKEHGKSQKENFGKETSKAASDYEKQLEGAFLALKEGKKGEMNWAFQQKAMDSFQSYQKLLNTLK
ncbi:hypothetical protein [Bacillus sp. NEB1478]|uniref:hypothetical protein n=1 Tax=Bacillus sp. NEB1478 TaxID=3073816 RepID=UPI002873EC6E|nr:hypothetical protein [Bacillus sp. NEB1478]WNB93263.1 hypothetical protein RGB74_06220 [Bacillus sp. NEB1478]